MSGRKLIERSSNSNRITQDDPNFYYLIGLKPKVHQEQRKIKIIEGPDGQTGLFISRTISS